MPVLLVQFLMLVPHEIGKAKLVHAVDFFLDLALYLLLVPCVIGRLAIVAGGIVQGIVL